MKKISFILGCLITSAGVINAQQVELPAAYGNSSSILVKESTFPQNENNRQVDLNAEIPFTGIYGTNTNNRTTDLIYSNGPHYSIAGTGGAPNLSVLEDLSLGMGTYGTAVSISGPYSIADDVTLSEGYDITSIDVYGYQTGTPFPSITAVFIQVWDGDPSAGGSVIWGDLSTNLLDGVQNPNTYRVLESDLGGTSRAIQRVQAATLGLSLDAGTYWIEYSLDGSGSSGPWSAPIVITGQGATGNAMQNTSTGWSPMVDDIYPQGVPFEMYGTPLISVKDNVIDGFSFYPNPISDFLNLSANKNIESVSLFNLLGQKVMRVKVDATTSSINMGRLAAGNYVMHVTAQGQTGTYKITKK